MSTMADTNGEPTAITGMTPRAITIEEAVSLKRASCPRVSPDGRLIAFCVGEVSKAEEHARGTISLVPADGNAPPRPFTTGPGLDADPAWSPDGTRLAFISDRHERGKPALYVMPTDGGEAERLVTERGEASAPRWSPDGSRISFLLKEIDTSEEEKRKKEGRDDAVTVDTDDRYTRLWLVDVASREVTRLSPIGRAPDPSAPDGPAPTEQHVLEHAWSPDGSRIAYLYTPTPRINDAYAATLETLTPQPPLPAAGEGEPDVATSAEREPDVATSAEREPDVATSHKDRQWVLSSAKPAHGAGPSTIVGSEDGDFPSPAAESENGLLPSPAAESENSLLPSPTHGRGAGGEGSPGEGVCRVYGYPKGLCWSPDGTRLAVIGGEIQQPFVPSNAAPLVVSAGGGEPRPACIGHAVDVEWVEWLSDDELVVAGVEGTRGVYYRLPAPDAAAQSPQHLSALFAAGQPERGAPREYALSRDRGTMAWTRADTTSPGDLWAARPDGNPVRLTTLNPQLEGMAWSVPEEVSWTAPDGLEVRGLLIRPLGYEAGRRYPAVVHPHGGPAGAWTDGFYASWHNWDGFLAARGYAVLLPNPRGSTGRGSAYLAANKGDVGGGEWQDVLSGARWAIDSGIADPERLGIGGWSWGGFLTAWAITQTTMFKAAVMGAGLSNLLSDHGQNDIPDANRLIFDSLPYDDFDSYWRVSPLRDVARVTTPTLILHGEKDARVTPAQGQEFYRALTVRGVPTRFALYPREGHPIEERAHQLDLLRRVLEWFDRFLAISR